MVKFGEGFQGYLAKRQFDRDKDVVPANIRIGGWCFYAWGSDEHPAIVRKTAGRIDGRIVGDERSAGMG